MLSGEKSSSSGINCFEQHHGEEERSETEIGGFRREGEYIYDGSRDGADSSNPIVVH